MDIALLIARFVLGLGLAAHGAQKLFGSFGGHGTQGTQEFLVGLGFPPSRVFPVAAGLGEFCGGCLLALGLFGALGPALMITVMVVAIGSVHLSHGFFNDDHGMELPLAYCMGAMLIAVIGPGQYSLDSILHLEMFWSPAFAWGSIAVAIVVAFLMLTFRHPHAAGSHGTQVPSRR